MVSQERQTLSAQHLALPAAVGPHQQAWALRFTRQREQLEQVGLAIADTHQGGVRHLGGDPQQGAVGRQPLTAFPHHGSPAGLMLLRIACPALSAHHPQRHPVGGEKAWLWFSTRLTTHPLRQGAAAEGGLLTHRGHDALAQEGVEPLATDSHGRQA